ncbi:glycine C-acetyltransferase [Pedobacter sp. AK017]|uniref:aminotransferase class I/II-fold pyridoxal phosphate-dependent enzyme n=1 Tax=Pedobacter sp. AK017 TaxID=2723073 RepID=UPI001619A5DD|nr:aminotransferase class I/II-fold pyridoxal phosphate-dependent enzyme [Pedobacter sp. AK017]MBB5440582.1 glycine C-acetyltransferase [Pedobacter sp. AK017]
MRPDFNQSHMGTFAAANLKDCDMFERAALFSDYIAHQHERGLWNYRNVCISGCRPEVELDLPDTLRHIKHKTFVATVFNDYLGFSQHPAVKAAAIAAIDRYGVGVTASPAIGGQMDFHREIEQATARFFRQESAILFTTGYTANSATMLALLNDKDLVLADMSAHASMFEGMKNTNMRTFSHNDMGVLERKLKENKGRYRNMTVVIDGVYSQPADLAKLDEIVFLCKHYGARLAMDDAHGIGVIGQTGRGVIEHFNAWQDVDIITGTFSKTLGHLGGYVVASPEMIRYLQFQAGQHIFSVAPTPASLCVIKSMALLDEEPWWQAKLWENISYLKKGLHDLGLDTGNSASAIVPVMIGSAHLNAQVCRWLLEAGIYACQIGYPAVNVKGARIRMSLMATHTVEHLDRILNAWEWVKTKMNIRNFE